MAERDLNPANVFHNARIRRLGSDPSLAIGFLMPIAIVIAMTAMRTSSTRITVRDSVAVQHGGCR